MNSARQHPDAKFFDKVHRSFRSLFQAAQNRHELHFAWALIPELRGMQDAGWSTAEETQRAFDEYLNFLQTYPHGTFRVRVALSFYCHLSEASGFYEIPKNMMRVAGGQPPQMWPFLDLVEKHKQTGARIAPNANKIHKDLAGHAAELGLQELAEIFRDAFDPDIRNAYSHSDYTIYEGELRLPT